MGWIRSAGRAVWGFFDAAELRKENARLYRQLVEWESYGAANNNRIAILERQLKVLRKAVREGASILVHADAEHKLADDTMFAESSQGDQ